MRQPHKATSTTGSRPPTIPPAISARADENRVSKRGPSCPPSNQPRPPQMPKQTRLSVGVAISKEGSPNWIDGKKPMPNSPPMAPVAAPAAAPKLTSPNPGPRIVSQVICSGDKLSYPLSKCNPLCAHAPMRRVWLKVGELYPKSPPRVNRPLGPVRGAGQPASLPRTRFLIFPEP